VTRVRGRFSCALVLVTAFGLAGCVGGDGPGGSARDGGSIDIGVSALPETLDPALASEPSELQLLWLVHTPLLTYRRASGRDGDDVVPGLARALPRVSKSGQSYRLSLRPGLQYTNGAPVRAGDFERAIDRLRALDSPLAPLYSNIVSIDADAATGAIHVTLARPDAAFTHVLALPASAPLPRGTPVKDLSDRPPPGVGPYRLVRSGKRIALLRRRTFELPGVPAGHIDRISLVRRGPPDQARAVITGSLDVMQEPAPFDILPELRSKYRKRYREEPTASTVALVPDTEAPPLDDATVRRAVSESLDAKTLTRLYKGLLTPSCNLLPEAVRGYRRLDPCPYGGRDELPDLPAAAELIDKAAADGARVRVVADAGVPAAVERNVIATLQKIGLAASARRGGAHIRVKRFAPIVGHPAAFFEPLAPAIFDADIAEEVERATAARAGEEADDAWATADRRVIEEGYATPLGSERRTAFFSERVDVENCARFQPLFGLDLSSLCLR
jgi:peptide/nickel transport system substrate-binding protein